VTGRVLRAVPRPGDDVSVSPCAGGPTLVRRAVALVDDSGVEHPVERPVVAVCTCERSQRLPWCDSTHKVARNTGSGVEVVPGT